MIKKRFEIYILRPLFVFLISSAIYSLVNSLWLCLMISALCLFYLGIIGSKLHPYQTALDLAKGPLTSKAAIVEKNLLTTGVDKALVSPACTRVGILIGFIFGFILWDRANWHWYSALIIAFLTMVLAGGILKSIFDPQKK